MHVDDKLKNEILNTSFFVGKVVTGSMIPVIKIGDTIKVEVKARNLKRFDIIVFLRDGRLICHFLWQENKQVEPKLYQTRSMYGKKDFPIKEDEYMGRVISHRMKWYHIIQALFFPRKP